MSRRKY